MPKCTRHSKNGIDNKANDRNETCNLFGLIIRSQKFFTNVSGVLFLAFMIMSVVGGVIQFLKTVLWKEFIDNMEQFAIHSKDNLNMCYFLVIFFVVSEIVIHAYNSILTFIKETAKTKIDRAVQKEVANKCGQLEYEKFEDLKVYEQINRAKESSGAFYKILLSEALLFTIIIRTVILALYLSGISSTLIYRYIKEK